MRAVPLLAIAAALGLAAPATSAVGSGRAAGAARVEAARDDPATLEALLSDQGAGEGARARALLALGRAWPTPLPGSARLRLRNLLADPASPVRRAAVRLVRERKERPLEREVLKLVAEDPDPGVRAEALDAVEPWTRPTHLYFLEAALGSDDPGVRARAVRNLGRLAARDLRPELRGRIRQWVAGGDPRVRAAALRTLAAWGELTDAALMGVLSDPDAPEFLVLSAVEVAQGRRSADLAEALTGALEGATSLRVAWASFEWLRENAPTEQRVYPALARILDGETRTNRALETFARHLESAGYRVEHGKVGWRVLKRP